MGKCPKCGTEVSKPKKTWKMAGRPDKAGKRMQLEIGLYESFSDMVGLLLGSSDQ